MMKAVLILTVCSGFVLFGSSRAQEPATPEQPVATPTSTPTQLSLHSPDEWWFEIKPYVWATAVGVDAEVGPVSGETDANFGDILDTLDGVIMLHAEAHKGSWGIFSDVMWVKMSDDEDGLGPTGGGEIDVEFGMLFLELGGLYRFGENKLTFEPLFGMRAVFTNSEVEITAGTGGDAEFDGDSSWVEPMIGGRIAYQFTEKFNVGIRGDVSGFGIGSEITWNVDSEFRYRFTDLFSMSFGYRYMFIDYEEDNAEIETTLHGPTIGFIFSF